MNLDSFSQILRDKLKFFVLFYYEIIKFIEQMELLAFDLEKKK
jgi:hypothetical protein